MWALALVALSAVATQDRPKAPNASTSAADRVTLKNGATVLGQVTNPNDRGKLIMVVRRAWARQALPDRAAEWERAEAPWLQRARDERLRRMQAWQADRRVGRDGADPLDRDIAREIERLENAGPNDDPAPLLMVALDRRDLTKIERRPANLARLLRLAWLTGIEGVEEMPLDEIRGALEARNVLTRGDDPASIDELLPMPIEDEARWMLRRGATEAHADRSAWFALFSGALLPESGGAGGLNLAGTLPDLMRNLLGDGAPPDPIPAKLSALGQQGKAGAVITELEYLPDLAGVSVQSTLWVRTGTNADQWQPALRQAATVRTSEIAPGAEINVQNDPQVKGIFDTVEGLGLGAVPPEMKQRALAIGAATQHATTRAKSLLNQQMSTLIIHFGAPR